MTDADRGEQAVGCSVCNRLACVCEILEEHDPRCRFRISATCAVAIECRHGYDVCPICDPCTCAGAPAAS